LDFELESLTPNRLLGEQVSSGCSSSEDENYRKQKKNKLIQYAKLTMIYEENAPFPPPLMTFN